MRAWRAGAAATLAILACIAVFTIYEDSTPSVKASAGDDSVIHAIVELKAYCVAAKPILNTIDELSCKEGEPCLRSGPAALIDSFGDAGDEKKKEENDIVTEFATVIGDLHNAADAEGGEDGKGGGDGFSSYILDQMNSAILQGSSVLKQGADTNNKKTYGKTYFSSQHLGLQDTPEYFHHLAVSVLQMADARKSIHAGKQGAAIAAWAKAGVADAYKKFYSKLKAQYLANQMQEDMLEEEGAKVAVHASFTAGADRGDSPQVLAHPLPLAASKGSLMVRQQSKFKMPTDAQISQEAVAQAKEYMAQLKAENNKAEDIIALIENKLRGTTVALKTGMAFGSESAMSPKVTITAETGKTIQGSFDALPVQGSNIEQVFETAQGDSLGQVKEITIEVDGSDAAAANAWLCNGAKVQVGHGQPWVTFVPEAFKAGDSNTEEFWVASSDGDGPFYGRPHGKSWRLVPKA